LRKRITNYDWFTERENEIEKLQQRKETIAEVDSSTETPEEELISKNARHKSN
jgi:hypothetical protein